MRVAPRHVLPGLLSIAAFLCVVQALSFAKLLPITVSPPSAIAAAFAAGYGTVWYHLAPTMAAAAIGFLAAACFAFALGMVAHFASGTARVITGVAVAVYALPLVALAPILAMWFGTGLVVRVAIAALAGFYPILVGCLQGWRAVEKNSTELMHMLAASRFQRFRFLELPTALPFILSGLKISAASAVLGAIVAEWTGAERGLGMFMAYALFSFDVPNVWLAVVVCIAAALTSYGVVALLERLVLDRYRGRQSTVDAS
jgi:ABC-type nitrate/sulfonate/bicarbonate transport system permease component